MKRLFTLRYQNGQLALDSNDAPYYFDSKAAAKHERDKRHAGFKVSIGPDHDGYKGRPHARRSRFKRLRGTR
jgi:hypothetical protein